MSEAKVTNERICRFEAKYGSEASKELISIINDTRSDLGYHDEAESKAIAEKINEGTKQIVNSK